MKSIVLSNCIIIAVVLIRADYSYGLSSNISRYLNKLNSTAIAKDNLKYHDHDVFSDLSKKLETSPDNPPNDRIISSDRKLGNDQSQGLEDEEQNKTEIIKHRKIRETNKEKRQRKAYERKQKKAFKKQQRKLLQQQRKMERKQKLQQRRTNGQPNQGRKSRLFQDLEKRFPGRYNGVGMRSDTVPVETEGTDETKEPDNTQPPSNLGTGGSHPNRPNALFSIVDLDIGWEKTADSSKGHVKLWVG